MRELLDGVLLRLKSLPKWSVFAAVALALVVVLGAGAAFGFGGGGDSKADGEPEATATSPAGSPSPSATPTSTTPTTTPTPEIGASGGEGATEYTDSGGSAAPAPRPYAGPASATGHVLVIPAYGVQAAVTYRAVGADGYMMDPNGPTDAVYYDFSAMPGLGGFPGSGGNSVFAGHVDYHNYGRAVFYNLQNLVPGDIVEVHLDTGVVVTYSIQWSAWLDPEEDFTSYVAWTDPESITLVTCIGTFDYSTRHYSHRLIVRGVRI